MIYYFVIARRINKYNKPMNRYVSIVYPSRELAESALVDYNKRLDQDNMINFVNGWRTLPFKLISQDVKNDSIWIPIKPTKEIKELYNKLSHLN